MWLMGNTVACLPGDVKHKNRFFDSFLFEKRFQNSRNMLSMVRQSDTRRDYACHPYASSGPFGKIERDLYLDICS